MGILPLLSLWTAYVSCENRTPDRTGNSNRGGSWGQTHCKTKHNRVEKGGSTSETVPPRVPPGVMWGLSSLTCRWCGEKVQQESKTKIKLWKRGVFHTADLSLSVQYNVGFNGVAHRQTVAGMDSFPWPGTQADSQDTQSHSHHSCCSMIQRWPHWFSCLANYHTNCLQHVESMHAHWAKISDHVAEIQKALNNSIVLGFEWKLQYIKLHITAEDTPSSSKSFTYLCVLLWKFILLTPSVIFF